MGLKRLLDTNVYVALERGHEGVAGLARGSAQLSTVVVGELLFGFRSGARYGRNARELDPMLSDVRVTDPVAAAGLAQRCISVRVRGAVYGLRMEEVREVIGVRPLARVFHAPPSVAGVMSLRGEILPVLDLAVVLGAAEATSLETDRARIVVVRETSGEKRRAGLAVDELGAIREVGAAGLVPPPSTVVAPLADFVAGVIPDAPPCTVLDVGALLEAEELRPLAASGGERE